MFLLSVAVFIWANSPLLAQDAPNPVLVSARIQDSGPSEGQRRIAQRALSLVGRSNLKFAGRSYPFDCSGTVLATLWLAGLDVNAAYGSYSGNGVKRLYSMGQDYGVDYDLPLPEIGDIVFWDNTYDMNGDKLWNDPLTHAGIVVAVDSNGTISYVHQDYKRGIVVAKMNLLQPETRFLTGEDGTRQEINSPMRMDSDRYLNPSKWLSSHLFRGFARVHMLLDEALSGSPSKSDSASTSSIQ